MGEKFAETLRKMNMPIHLSGNGLLYKYVTVHRAKQIIADNKLWFSTAADFNDPFELSTDNFDLELRPYQLKKLLTKTNPYLSRQKRKEYLQNLSEQSTDIAKTFREHIEKLRNSFGICCFSKRYDSTLMWSHYADSHKGICLGFEIDSTDSLYILGVNYVTSRDPIIFWDQKYEMLPHWLFTKSHVWSYEEEVRAVKFYQKGLIGFDPTSLKAVHFGLHTTLQQESEIQAMLALKNISVEAYKMKINSETYDIIRSKV